MSATPNTSKKSTLIGIIDKQMIMRVGLSTIFYEAFNAVDVLAASSLDEMTNIPESCNLDVILLGLDNTTKKGGLANVARLRMAFPHQKLIVYDDYQDFRRIVGYFRHGIDGYIHKRNSEGEMYRCVKNVLYGTLYLCPQHTETLLQHYIHYSCKSSFRVDLSRRESEVAKMLCIGMNTSAIAQSLRRKPSTISTIKLNILRKTKTSNILELMEYIQLKHYSRE